MWARTIAVVFVLFGCVFVRGESPPTKPDAQAGYEPRSAPGEGQKYLERLTGDWDVRKTFFSKSGPPVVTSGKCTQSMVNDGRFLKSDFTFEDGTNQDTGLGLIGFDPDTGVFTSVWVDSRSTRMSFRQSEDPFDGKQIVLYSRALESIAVKANSRKSRTVTTIEDNGNRVQHRQYASTADGEERLILQLTLTKHIPTTQPSGEKPAAP
jgi:hypothetical protein